MFGALKTVILGIMSLSVHLRDLSAVQVACNAGKEEPCHSTSKHRYFISSQSPFRFVSSQLPI